MIDYIIVLAFIIGKWQCLIVGCSRWPDTATRFATLTWIASFNYVSIGHVFVYRPQ